MKKFPFLLVLALLLCPIFVLATDKVEINTASLEQLDEIIGIGPVLAQRIIDARPFSSVDDLLKVKGIGEKTLQKIKEQGLAYVEGMKLGPSPSPTPTEIPTPIVETLSVPVISTPDISPIAGPAAATTATICPEGIIFSEILPSPEGADQENEWIEIFNQNEEIINLSGLKIKDSEGAVASYIFPNNSKIASKEYLVLNRKTTKITLNNTGDKLVILCDEKILDSVSYGKVKTKQSYNKAGSEWLWSEILTPGKENIISITKISGFNSRKNQAKLTDVARPINRQTNENIDFQKKETANIGEKMQIFTKNLYPLAIALILAIFSSLTIFTLKKNLKKM